MFEVCKGFDLLNLFCNWVQEFDKLGVGSVLFNYPKVVLLGYKGTDVASFALHSEEDLFLVFVHRDCFDHMPNTKYFIKFIFITKYLN